MTSEPDGADRPRILLLAGSGRSGSTLIERAVGGVAGVTTLGETVHLWERGLRDGELCSCERPFRECPFWSEVGDAAFGGWDALDPAEVSALREVVVRTRHLPGLLTPLAGPEWRGRRDELGALIGSLFRGVRAVTGSQLLLDSSKLPAYAALLRHADVDVRCVRVVRDPRGVAHSLGKTVQRPEVTDGSATMYRLPPAKAALWWSVLELQTGALAVRGMPLTTVRYEDFVADPRGVVGRVLDFAGIRTGAADLDHLQPGAVQLPPGHLVAGNPMRFRTGTVALRPDEAWRTAMGSRDRRIVDLLTIGLRQRHGYR
ncbi:MAG: sulfotransferase [Pseudonocardiales bacterium]|jgi:hypothetical protein|nr:sulfotransferase [Pseudonocardiales bacterium]